MLYTFTVGINAFFRYNKFHQEFLVKKKRYSDLKKRNIEIDSLRRSLNDDSFWESLSRDKLRMIKKGEVLYHFYYEEN